MISTSSGAKLTATKLTDLIANNVTIDTGMYSSSAAPKPTWDSWIGTTPYLQSEEEKKEKQEKLFEMQKAVFDSDIESEMKIKIISFIGKYVE